MFKKRRESPPAKRQAGKMPMKFILGVFLFLFLALVNGSASKTQAGLADHVVINEVSIDSVLGSGGTEDDWVELYNPTDQAVSLTGWSLQKATSTGGVSNRVALSKTIAAKDYFLVVRKGSATSQSLKSAANLLVGSSFSLAEDNTIILVNDNNNITGPDDLNIVDYVGYGAVSLYEGTAPAPAVAETKSIARMPAGEDTNQNSVDFVLQDNPTPISSASGSGDDDIGGTVLLTITPDTTPAQSIGPTEAQVVFQVNAAGSAKVKYGLDTTYAGSTAPQTVATSTTKIISLTGLACDTVYHYVVYAENAGATENDTTADATFTTLSCGITLDSLAMTKATAKANNQYADGWQWEFNITVWNPNEILLKMKFNQWTGAAALSAGGNMQYSVDSGANWRDIVANATYPANALDISGVDNSASSGRQVKIVVRMKVPVGTAAGYYSSSYGILTE